MIDHVLGRPSARSRRLQVLAVLSFWLVYLKRGHKHGPPIIRILSKFFTKRLSPWQIVTMAIMYLYAARNFSSLIGLASPDPLSKMYEASFFRATWVLTAMDAGFWTAMKIRNKRLRDLASIIFTVFYLFAADLADEKVRRVRANLTIDHLRVAWNKPMTPYLLFFQNLIRPRFLHNGPREIRIPRPAGSDYTEPVTGWIYFDGTIAQMQKHRRILIDIPGGGFVAMSPRCNDDKLGCWASKTGVPILALDYKKAPEFPYPYALNECFDVYTQIIRTKGRCIGLAGYETPQIVLSGDSSGGNLATATTLMILERTIGHLSTTNQNRDLPPPESVILFYPCLDMNIGSWMSDEEMALIRDRRSRGTNKAIVRRKTMQYSSLVGTPHHSDDEDGPPEKSLPERFQIQRKRQMQTTKRPSTSPVKASTSKSGSPKAEPPPALTPETTPGSFHPKSPSTRLAMSSKISYFSDRVLTPEMMRAMVIMYIGPHNRPDFKTDYLLSPTIAPNSLLAHFPKVYFLTGERDPLVDDTVIFAGRLRQARHFLFETRNASTSSPEATFHQRGRDDYYAECDILELTLIPGVSHGFLQFPTIYPKAWGFLEQAARWIDQSFQASPGIRRREMRRRDLLNRQAVAQAAHIDDSDSDEEPGIEMARLRTKSRPRPYPSSLYGGSGSDTIVLSVEDSGVDVADTEARRDMLSGLKDRIEGLVTRKSPELEKLDSEEDLLRRRMEGLAGGLIGSNE